MLSVYGVRKMWKALARAGETVGRDQVTRLMRELGIQGACPGRRVRTTRPDERGDRPPDLSRPCLRRGPVMNCGGVSSGMSSAGPSSPGRALVKCRAYLGLQLGVVR
jgi:transposase InsO family protein